MVVINFLLLLDKLGTNAMIAFCLLCGVEELAWIPKAFGAHCHVYNLIIVMAPGPMQYLQEAEHLQKHSKSKLGREAFRQLRN